MNSDIQERIEQILIDHTLVPGTDEVQAECVSAACLWRGWFLGDWRRHIAEVLVSELGLTPEWGVISRDEQEPNQIFDFRHSADKVFEARTAHGDTTATIVSRAVSDWKPA